MGQYTIILEIDGIKLVVYRRCRTGEVVNFINLHIERKCNVVSHHFKKGIRQKIGNIGSSACIEVVDS